MEEFIRLSGQDVFDNVSIDIRQAVVATLMEVGQSRVIHAHQVEDGGVEVVDMDAIGDGGEAEFVGFAVGLASLDFPACHPHGEAIRVVISTGFVDPFAEGHATKFSAPDDQGFIEEATLFQIGEEGSDGLIDFGGVLAVVFLDAEMSIPGILEVPASGIELDEANSPFETTACDEAIASIRRLVPD